VQTERAAHEAWADLITRKPRAAALLHLLVANMNRTGALVCSQGTLSVLTKASVATVKRALTVLVDENFIEVVRVGSERGGVNAYVVNRRVAWADKRENQRYAAFDARILVSESEQDGPVGVESEALKQLPTLSPGDMQLPHGAGLPPPTQPPLVEPDLPSLREEEQLDLLGND
jgi:DNA-binding transcriptional regulator YhcF (GntR family)